MSTPVINVEKLAKAYTITHKNYSGEGLRHYLTDQFANLFKQRQEKSKEVFWALRDVSLSLNKGEVLGIVGHNGAGKSTLLKLLSRITEPTKGRITLNGRVASLLEVGTGFHPELTGRENIFLNGAILGMRKAEIIQKLDEIVEFSEIEKFLDTPVKRYSSGMYVRLAFAVAAHLEPEILLVDEVLAVGDAKFQKKCLGKMEEVSASSGRSILFVSHNMAAISKLCEKAVLLEKGRIKAYGNAEEITKAYLMQCDITEHQKTVESKRGLTLERFAIQDQELKKDTRTLFFRENYEIVTEIKASSPIEGAVFEITIGTNIEDRLSTICTIEEGIHPFTAQGKILLKCTLKDLKLYPGEYFLSFFVYKVHESEPYLAARNALKVNVEPKIINNAMWAYKAKHGYAHISEKVEITLENM